METGFCGPGLMGAPMIRHLLRAGHTVHVWNRTRAKAEALRAEGAHVVDTPRELAARCDAVLLCVADAAAVEQTVFGPAGLLDGEPGAGHPGAGAPAAGDPAASRRLRWIVDHSSIPPAATRALARRAADVGAQGGAAGSAAPIGWIDAPVSGGVAGAKAASLTFMVGGAAAAFVRGKPILERMGKRVVHCGDAGNGQVAKICNNMILGATMIATCEAFVLAEKLGLSAQALFDVASTSSGQSWSLTSYCPVPGPVPNSPANRDYKPGFAAALMLKDLRLAQEAALSAGASTPIGAQAAQLYALFAASGHAGDDFSGIVNFLRGA